MRFRYLPMVLALAGTLLAQPGYADPPPAPAPAPAPDPHAPFAGTFKWVGGPSEQAAWKAAIDKSTENLFFLIRGMARSKLASSFKIEPTMTFTFENGMIRAHSTGLDPLSPENGAWVDYKPDGGKAKLSQKVTGPKLVQIIAADDGKRVNEWVAQPDGVTLKVLVTITSPQLSGPCIYTLTYKKQ